MNNLFNGSGYTFYRYPRHKGMKMEENKPGVKTMNEIIGKAVQVALDNGLGWFLASAASLAALAATFIGWN